MTTQSDAEFTMGIDIGGTFTDIVCRGASREVAFKTPSTPHDQSEAVSVALRRLHDEYGIAPASITRFVHGTTVSTNALIERRGARLGLIMTEGFGDTIEIGRQIRRQLYDLALKPETPGWLAPGVRRAEVKERIAADGSVVERLDDASLAEAIDRLGAQEVEAIAVCLLFSFSRPKHELRVRDAIRKRLPNVAISLSHEVDPTFREYERTVATAFDAYVKPVVDRYLQRLRSVLSDAGSPASVQVMQSRGGLSGVDTARARPIRLTLSGPAAGVIGAVEEGVRAGSKDLISIDIGGTSSDIALIRDGQPAVANEAEVAGYKVRVPMLDVVTLGAGGGSIAWLDAAGGLKVGPHSAGSDPGPACYGAGGTEATVTDASIVLGFLNPNNFAGGTITLDPDLSWRVIDEKIATPMGLSVEEAAAGIHKIANAHMADGIRLVSLRRGHDPRDFALLGLGGGGGVHAAALSEEIGISRLVVPQRPGVLSAAGLLSAPVEHEVSASHAITLANADMARIREVVEDLHARAATLMRSDGASDAVTSREVIADLAYVGQSYTLAVPFHPDASDALRRAYSAFEVEHERVNGLATGAPGKLVNLRVVHTYQNPSFPEAATHVTSDARETTRRVIFPGHPPLETRVLVRAGIAVGTSLEGPLVIEQRDATTLVPPGWRAYAHESGALVMENAAVTSPSSRPAVSDDPITLEVICHRLDTIAEEMETVLLRSSCSPIVKEGLDASASLFTTDGKTLSQACAIPIHLGTLIPAVAAILEAFPLSQMQEGDVYLLNDPYHGGTHLPDFAVLTPLFAEGRPLALAATMTHHQDVGGKTAGSVPTDSTEIWQEGLRIPPLRWIRNGSYDETLTALLKLNVRVPHILMGDLHAQIAACRLAGTRLRDTAHRYGAAALNDTFTTLLDRSEIMTRAAVRQLTPGTYHFVDELDNDGVDIDKRIPIEVTATVEDSDIHFDLTGTSPQVRGPVNCVPSGSFAAACYALRAVTDSSIPNNAGCFRSIRLTLPPDSLVNPTAPAPVNARTATIKRITGCMLGALAQAMPDRAIASNAGELVVMAFGGTHNGETFVTGDLLAGGSGAGPDGDGVDAIETDATNCMNVPAEAMELESPIRVRRCALRRGTGGAGTTRGGLGLVKEFEILADDGVSFSHRGERHFSPAKGIDDGQDGGLAYSEILRRDGTIEVIPSKIVTRLEKGDRVSVGTAGGAGRGDPGSRDPSAAHADQANGKV